MSDKFLLFIVLACAAFVACCHFIVPPAAIDDGLGTQAINVASSEPRTDEPEDEVEATPATEPAHNARDVTQFTAMPQEAPAETALAEVETQPAPLVTEDGNAAIDPITNGIDSRESSFASAASPDVMALETPQANTEDDGKEIAQEQRQVVENEPATNETLVQLDEVDEGFLPEPQVATVEDCEPKFIDLSVGEVKTLRIDIGNDQLSGIGVIEFDNSNQDVCEAILTRDNKIQLIGTGKGQAQLSVRAIDSDGPTRILCEYGIFVLDSKESANQVKPKTVASLNRAVQKVYPDCRVTIRAEGTGLVVEGTCDDQQSAESIIDLVRKVCLVGVRDELRSIKQVDYVYPDPVYPLDCCR